MESKMENSLSRPVAVKEFMNKYHAIWSANVPIVNVMYEIDTSIKAAQCICAENLKIEKNISENKGLIKTVMIGFAMNMQAAVLAYASSEEDEILLETLSFSKWKLEHSHDSKVYDLCKLIYDVSLSMKKDLKNYAIVQTDYDNLHNSIKEFGSMLQSPRGMLGENSNFITQMLNKINYLIGSKLNYYMLPYKKEESRFYNGYKNVSVIHYMTGAMEKQGSLIKGKTMNIESGADIANVHIWIAGEENTINISNEAGYFEVEIKNTGNYLLVAEKEGYYQSYELLNAEEGKTYVINFELEKTVGAYIANNLLVGQEH